MLTLGWMVSYAETSNDAPFPSGVPLGCPNITTIQFMNNIAMSNYSATQFPKSHCPNKAVFCSTDFSYVRVQNQGIGVTGSRRPDFQS